jgi:hypothetical protein
MANITEQDIINHLKQKIEFYEHESKRLQGLLSAFTNSSIIEFNGKAKLKGSDGDLAPASKARQINPRGKRKTKEEQQLKEPELAEKTIDVPEKYTDDLTINAKVIFALKEIGSGFNEDIANAMAQYEPKSDAKKISKQISGVLSALKTRGQVRAEKAGRKDKFSLVV